jgi:hypothetical protein
MKKISSFFTLLSILHFCLPASLNSNPMNIQDYLGENTMESNVLLPKSVGIWTRPETPKIITAKNIFDYMDGAGELYIAYRFDHLESFEYRAETQKEILVELYFMETSDDAFGLLSLDWGGEPMDLNESSLENISPDKYSWPRALYGEGLLRIWSDNVYARVMATQETPESKKAVLELGRKITKDRTDQPPPAITKALPDSIHKNWKLRKDRIGFFRSHMILNSLYYLGHENMLDLDLSAEAIVAPYEKMESPERSSRIQFLAVKYLNHEHAKNALTHFHHAYLPDYTIETHLKSSKDLIGTYAIEDGWLGYKLHQNTLTVVFECPDQETAVTIIDQIN